MFEIPPSPPPLFLSSFFLTSVLSKTMLKMRAETQTGLRNERGAPVALKRWGLRSKYSRWMRLIVRCHSRGTHDPREKVPTH